MRGGLGALLACVGLWAGSVVVSFGVLLAGAIVTARWGAGRTSQAVPFLLGGYVLVLAGASAIAWKAVSVALGPGAGRVVALALFLLLEVATFAALAVVTALALNR